MKIVLNYNDSRWEKYNIDFGGIVNTAARFAARNTRTARIMRRGDRNLVSWMRVAFGIGAFANIDREISIILTNDKEIRKLNKEYRGFDKATNVLSFETGDDELLGDIFISFDTVWKEAGGNEDEFINHASHMVVHGFLHLMGYDHLVDADAEKMENLEIVILKKLGIKNPY